MKAAILHKKTCALKIEEITNQSRAPVESPYLKQQKMLLVGHSNAITTKTELQIF